MTPTYNTSMVRSKCSIRQGKGKETQVIGNEPQRSFVRVDGYHRTVELMSTTTCVNLGAQLLLLRRSMFVVSG